MQDACDAKVDAKFDGGTRGAEKGCFTKLEFKEKPDKSETLCPTKDDSAAIMGKVGALVDDILSEITSEP